MLSDNRQDLMDGALGEGERRRKCEMGAIKQPLHLYSLCSKFSSIQKL